MRIGEDCIAARSVAAILAPELTGDAVVTVPVPCSAPLRYHLRRAGVSTTHFMGFDPDNTARFLEEGRVSKVFLMTQEPDITLDMYASQTRNPKYSAPETLQILKNAVIHQMKRLRP